MILLNSKLLLTKLRSFKNYFYVILFFLFFQIKLIFLSLVIQEYLINKLTKSDEGKETFNPFALRELTHFISYYSWIVLIFQVWLKLLPTGKKKSEEVKKRIIY